ncbi:MAG TPA: prepilin-type cleavage/methylation domain-containing protein [Candidatus Nitrosotalea sp.]|nr:prepilin-type cleavage/methylation domain-containing protein [Candidatus Nitrosotalea sp.]
MTETHAILLDTARRSRGSNRADVLGFTLTELLVVIAALALMAVTILPALARTRPDSQVFQCLSNHKRLMQAWSVYAADYADHVPNNFTIPETESAITTGRLDNWVNNIMTWDTAGIEGQSVTNNYWVTNGVFGRYTGSDVEIYRCPADSYLSPAQRSAGWTQRNRSISMNALFGLSDHTPNSANGRSWYNSAYRQFLKTTDVPSPTGTWVLIEEHADSINEGFFIVDINATSWGDLPASYHNGACTFSFADGHAEEHPWLSQTSKYSVKYSYLPRHFDALGKQDFQWYKARTGFTLLR